MVRQWKPTTNRYDDPAPGVEDAQDLADRAIVQQRIREQRVIRGAEFDALTGRFVANWANAPVGALHAYLRKAMPQFAPGSLSEQDATNLAACPKIGHTGPVFARKSGTSGRDIASDAPSEKSQ